MPYITNYYLCGCDAKCQYVSSIFFINNNFLQKFFKISYFFKNKSKILKQINIIVILPIFLTLVVPNSHPFYSHISSEVICFSKFGNIIIMHDNKPGEYTYCLQHETRCTGWNLKFYSKLFSIDLMSFSAFWMFFHNFQDLFLSILLTQFPRI